MRLLKLFSLLTLLFACTSAWAEQSACFGGDKVLHTCRSKIQPMDQEMAARHFSETAFCQADDLTTYAVVANFTAQQETIPLTAQTGKTGVRYLFGMEDLMFEMRVNPAVKTPANSKLTVTY